MDPKPENPAAPLSQTVWKWYFIKKQDLHKTTLHTVRSSKMRRSSIFLLACTAFLVILPCVGAHASDPAGGPHPAHRRGHAHSGDKQDRGGRLEPLPGHRFRRQDRAGVGPGHGQAAQNSQAPHGARRRGQDVCGGHYAGRKHRRVRGGGRRRIRSTSSTAHPAG